MALISLQDVSLAFGGRNILDGLTLHVEQKERIALLGRNGEGKTTLMKVLAGSMSIDRGERVVQKGIKVTHLPQEIPQGISGTVFDIVFGGLGERAKLLQDYHHLAYAVSISPDEKSLQELGRLQADIDFSHGWDLDMKVQEVLNQLGLAGDCDFSKLSGGQKRRVLLAKALVIEPDVLLLDEPTNHLDIDTIEWLEVFLKSFPGTLVFVTHDRMFMSRLAGRIIELDRGKLFSWSCDYATFLQRRQMALEVERQHREEFDRRLAVEEAWIRRGVKARRTRNEGRVKALERMREEKKAQRQVQGQARISGNDASSSGHLVVKCMGISFSYGEHCIVHDFSTRIMRGDKIGVIGSNGSGKTTLLKLLLGQLTPQKGKVSLGTNLQIAYSNQLREQLDEEKTVMENVAQGSDTVMINGRPRHLIGYLEEFLFTPERSKTPVKVLSGGERNRLLLARLFTKPSNFLVMDEPTNDLDIETQELLEDLLVDYPGTLIIVSHDREFLNQVVTSTMVLEGKGIIHEYPGGYDDWVSQRPKPVEAKPKTAAENIDSSQSPVPSVQKRKLTFKENKEMESLPKRIEALEAEQEELFKLSGQPGFYHSNPKKSEEVRGRLEAITDELKQAYARWEELDSKAA